MNKECRKLFLTTIIVVLIHKYLSCELSDFRFDLDHVDDDQRDRLFAYLDSNKDKNLNQIEFKSLFPILFYSTKLNKSYTDETKDEKLLCALDFTRDKQMGKFEFNQVWDKWIKIILKPIAALIVVDVQNDFIADNGSMPIKGGKTIVPVINELAKSADFSTIVYTYDWHPSNHCSFIENIHLRNISNSFNKTVDELKVGDNVSFTEHPDLTQRLWHRHCVQGSFGAELYYELNVATNSFNVTKGTNPDIDSYSAFHDNGRYIETDLHKNLEKRGITDVYLSGVLYEYCVGYTALDALSLHYRTAFVENAIHDLTKIEHDNMRTNLINKSASLIQSEDVIDMVDGRDRTFEMGLVLAEKVFKKH